MKIDLVEKRSFDGRVTDWEGLWNCTLGRGNSVYTFKRTGSEYSG